MFADFKKSTIAREIIVYVIGFSSLLTLVLTSFQLYMDYQNEVGKIETNLDYISRSFSSPLSNALWYMDKNQINKLLEGILKMPDIAKVKVESTDTETVELTKNLEPDGPRTFQSLSHQTEVSTRHLGQLQITSSLHHVKQYLKKKIVVLLLINLIKTLFMVSLIFFLFHQLLTKPLTKLSEDALNLYREQNKKLGLHIIESDQVASKQNEIEIVESSLNIMNNNFTQTIISLQHSEERFKDIISFSFDVIFETDEWYNFSFIHSRLNAQDPLTSELVFKNSIFILPFAEDIKDQLKLKASVKDKSFNLKKENLINFYQFSAKPILDSKTNRFKGYRGIISNVTVNIETKKLLEEQQSHIRQMQKLDAVGELTAGIAHDFNNIMAIIKGGLQMIKAQNIENEKVQKYLMNSQEASERGIKLVKRLMAFSRKNLPEPIITNLNDLLSSLEDIIQVGVSKKNLVVFNLQESLWPILIDNNLFENVVLNMCINARDAMPNGGCITIATENCELVDHSFIPQGHYVLMKISDTGMGIPMDIQKKIFEPFFTTKEVGKGTGLGLSMVANFVRQSQGHIDLYSKLGEGTTFYLYFPKVSNS